MQISYELVGSGLVVVEIVPHVVVWWLLLKDWWTERLVAEIVPRGRQTMKNTTRHTNGGLKDWWLIVFSMIHNRSQGKEGRG